MQRATARGLGAAIDASKSGDPMKLVYLAVAIGVLLASAAPLLFYLQGRFGNPAVERELAEEPDGARARKVMLLTLPSGRRIPVNYLREDSRIYAGADGRWWKELADGSASVQVLVRGEWLEGRARAVLDDPAYRKEIFARLRPTALPGFGTLIEIRLDPEDPGGPR